MIWSDHEISIMSAEATPTLARRALRMHGYERSQPSIEHKIQEMRRVDNGLPRNTFKLNKGE